MADFDALIDDYVQSELEYIDNEGEDWKIARDNARSALREAISSLQWDSDESMRLYNEQQKRACDAEARVTALEAQLNEADKDCENAWKICKSSPHWNNWITPQWDEHVARLSKRGQG